MKLLATLNPENVPDKISNTYPIREAARAVVIDNEGNVALLHVTRDNYYKLPGGGIEPGEDKISALHRECLEEIGSQIEVIAEVGMIVENRKFYTLRQISYCYFAKLKGEKGQPNFMPDEIAEGFEVVWIPYEKALTFLGTNEAIGREGHDYIVPRDALLLQTAEKLRTPMTPITIETIINAPLSKVWECWNEPKHITQWAFASDEWEAPSAENDLRTGGKFTTVMAAKDKSASFDFTGVYTKVIDQALIEYDMSDGRHVKIVFTKLPNGVKVIQTFDPESENPAEMQREGWQSILNNFKKYVESNS